jgi:hypothetical protein
MTTNWFGGPTTPSDPSTFDYETALQKVQRQRAAAQALQQMGMQGNQGQFVKNGDFIGYAGGNTLGSTIARVAAGLLSAKTSENADTAQKQVGLDSQTALSWALDPANSPAGQRAAAQQTQREADAELARESSRASSTVQAGEVIDPNAPLTDTAVQTFPVPAPEVAVLPKPQVPPTTHRIAAKMLGAAPAAQAAAPTLRPRADSIPVTGGPNSFGSGNDLTRTLGPKTSLPTTTTGKLSTDDVALAARLLGGAPAPAAKASGTHQNAHQAMRTVASAPALPQLAQASQAPALPIPPAPPAAPTLEDRARALGIDPSAPRGEGDPSLAQQVQIVEATQNLMARGINPTGDPRSMVEQSAAQGNANANFGDQMANLQQIARTGPMGQQLASSMMQSQFSKDWGEVKNADGATIGVYNKRNPSEQMAFKGVGVGTKAIETMSNLVKSTDPNSPEAVSRLNQTLGAMGIPPMTPDQVRGMGMTNDQRLTAHHSSANAVSSISKARGEAVAQVADLGKINTDLQYAMSIVNDAAGKWKGMGGSIAQWFGGGEQQQILNRILNDSMLMSIMQDKGGSGTAGVGLMQAYQQHGLKATMQPEALQQGLQQIQAAVQQRVSGKQAEVAAHDYSLNQLGYQPQVPNHQTSGGAPNGRAPGNYSF